MITILRHCESIYNIDPESKEIDCGLTEVGIRKAFDIVGSYDLVICSPMLRCLQTLAYSQIEYKKIIMSDACREYKQKYCDFLEDESIIVETEEELLLRVAEFKKYIKSLKNLKILVISHADFLFWLTSYKVNGEVFGKWLDNGEKIEVNIV